MHDAIIIAAIVLLLLSFSSKKGVIKRKSLQLVILLVIIYFAYNKMSYGFLLIFILILYILDGNVKIDTDTLFNNLSNKLPDNFEICKKHILNILNGFDFNIPIISSTVVQNNNKEVPITPNISETSDNKNTVTISKNSDKDIAVTPIVPQK